MISPVRLIFGVHSHQPVGNLDEVFTRALNDAYDPFLSALERHPSVSMVFHYSGCLLEWLDRHAPAHLDRLAVLARAGQIEMLTGGFYEPILPLIPPGDRVGQIRLMTRHLKERFGAEARGMWLAERIWEPTLPGTLAEAGVDFTILDDYHFLASMDTDPVGGYYVTEDQGKVTRLFPISERLRYLIPFREPEEAIEHLRQLGAEAQPGGREVVAVIVDDGEKFGMWPGTQAWVYGADGQPGWLDSFMGLLEDNASWLKTTTFQQVMREVDPRGRVYLPPGSYMEMGGWSLPTRRGREFAAATQQAKERPEWERDRPFLRGGFFRNFMAKYPESFLMLRRAQLLSAEMDHAAQAAEQARAGYPDPARRELWRAMCNCSYWHGIFGGLYLPHIRRSVGTHLCRARRLLDEATGAPEVRCRPVDVDVDGRDEIEIHTPQLGLLVEPAAGGALSVVDLKQGDIPLGFTLTRRIEVYHADMLSASDRSGHGEGRRSIHEIEVGASDEMKALVVADDRLRASAVDRFLSAGATPHDLARGLPLERGDFFNGRYDVRAVESPPAPGRGAARVVMERAGRVDGRPVTLTKSIAAEGGRLELGWRFGSPPPEGVLFAVELNLALIESTGRLRLGERVVPLSDTVELQDVERLVIEDDHLHVLLSLNPLPSAAVWHYPVRTVSRSERGYEANYQGSALLIVWGAASAVPRAATIVLEAAGGAAAGET
ncbi:MAG: alpha-amylase/4-alpha-glucanotransferase domain-containing protein [Candidatus Polarisedimenticolia bacterium]